MDLNKGCLREIYIAAFYIKTTGEHKLA
ncbi:hypothetical protein PTD2_03461 [Pseudoalteromonas tunicata D2]|uniref:Uncharacterized protein n=1 Tax=Pseudoalteromonas tunicata D2 TaxID=87626 RepID=A4C4W3_9GAMM|nr:hypothetical protein PTD2_03461 [Pseudoalteromonas tunicata D2]